MPFVFGIYNIVLFIDQDQLYRRRSYVNSESKFQLLDSEFRPVADAVSVLSQTGRGYFIVGHHITLEPGDESTLNVTGWRVITNGSAQEHLGARLEMDMPACNSLIVSAILDGETSITTVNSDAKAHDVYDLRGRKVRTGSTSLDGLPSGIYIIGGRKVIK